MRNKVLVRKNVVPFTGEFYPPQPEYHQPQSDSKTDVGIIGAYVAFSLIAGLSLGAILTYTRIDQVEIRNLKSQAEQFQKLQQQFCR